MLATIVDIDAIWKILLAAFAVGVGVTAIFGEAALAAQRIAAARREAVPPRPPPTRSSSCSPRSCASPQSSSGSSR
jgi:hypothetical protein